MNTYDITSKEIKQLYNNLKASAKKRNIPFDLSPTDIDDIGIPLTCPILGMPIYFYRGGVQPDSISFDRVDSSRGYTRDNLVIVSYRANKIKSDATLDELELVFNYYRDLNGMS